jgi:hypothetical protein
MQNFALSQSAKESEISCEMVSYLSNEPFLLSSAQPFRKTWIYYYKDLVLYTSDLMYERSYNNIELEPLKATVFFIGKKNESFLYKVKDSLLIKNIDFLKKLKKDSLLESNTMILSNNCNYADTSHFRVLSIKKNKNKGLMKVQEVNARIKNPDKNYILIYFSKKKLNLKHQIFPKLDSIFGMRIYKIYSREYRNKLYTEEFTLETKIEKLSKGKISEMLPFFESYYTCCSSILNR